MSTMRLSILALVASLCLPILAIAGEFPDDFFYPVQPEQRAKLDQLVGKPAPGIELTDWMNGQVSAADMKGKVVVVDVWATWCGPCKAAIPHNNELMEKYGDKGLLVVGACSSSKGQEKLADVVKDKNIKYPVGKDPTLKVQKDWHVMFYPTYAVVDRMGKVRAIGLTPNHVEDVVQKLLAEPGSARAD